MDTTRCQYQWGGHVGMGMSRMGVDMSEGEGVYMSRAGVMSRGVGRHVQGGWVCPGGRRWVPIHPKKEHGTRDTHISHKGRRTRNTHPRRDMGPGITTPLWTDRHLRKHYPPPTSLAGGKMNMIKYITEIHLPKRRRYNINGFLLI